MIKKPVLQLCATKRLLCLFILTFILLSIIPSASGQSESVLVEYFYEDSCLKCQKASPVIDEVTGRYDNINYSRYEITEHFSRMSEYGVYSVPVVVINRSIVIAYTDYNGDRALLETLLVNGIENAPPIADNVDLTVNRPSDEQTIKKISPFFVLIAGLIAGFNPCLMAIMAFLASVTLSSKGSRKDLLKIVIGFCVGIFVMYMIVGIGILNTIKHMPALKDTISLSMIIIISVLGLWHMYDAYNLKKHSRSTFKTPRSLITFISRMQNKNLLLLSFAAGAVFSLVKAPCVGAVYMAILNMLITEGNLLKGVMYLGFYNLGVILPILLLGGMLAFGLSPEKVTEFKENKRVEIRLFTGIMLLILALLMYYNVI